MDRLHKEANVHKKSLFSGKKLYFREEMSSILFHHDITVTGISMNRVSGKKTLCRKPNHFTFSHTSLHLIMLQVWVKIVGEYKELTNFKFCFGNIEVER